MSDGRENDDEESLEAAPEVTTPPSYPVSALFLAKSLGIVQLSRRHFEDAEHDQNDFQRIEAALYCP